jgi:hypothetical protein
MGPAGRSGETWQRGAVPCSIDRTTTLRGSTGIRKARSGAALAMLVVMGHYMLSKVLPCERAYRLFIGLFPLDTHKTPLRHAPWATDPNRRWRKPQRATVR